MRYVRVRESFTRENLVLAVGLVVTWIGFLAFSQDYFDLANRTDAQACDKFSQYREIDGTHIDEVKLAVCMQQPHPKAWIAERACLAFIPTPAGQVMCWRDLVGLFSSPGLTRAPDSFVPDAPSLKPDQQSQVPQANGLEQRPPVQIWLDVDAAGWAVAVVALFGVAFTVLFYRLGRGGWRR